MVMLGTKYYSSKKAKDGDIIKFVDEGGWVESKFKKPDGTPKNSFQIMIEVNGDQCIFNINKKNSEVLIEAFGHDTEKWIGKEAKVTLKETEVAGEDVLAIRLTPVENEGIE